jgi:hypothetical protein
MRLGLYLVCMLVLSGCEVGTPAKESISNSRESSLSVQQRFIALQRSIPPGTPLGKVEKTIGKPCATVTVSTSSDQFGNVPAMNYYKFGDHIVCVCYVLPRECRDFGDLRIEDIYLLTPEDIAPLIRSSAAAKTNNVDKSR